MIGMIVGKQDHIRFFQFCGQPVDGIRPLAEFNFMGMFGEVGSQVGGVDVDDRILGFYLNLGGRKPFNDDHHKWSLIFNKRLYVC